MSGPWGGGGGGRREGGAPGAKVNDADNESFVIALKCVT